MTQTVHKCTTFAADDLGYWRCTECGEYDVADEDEPGDQDVTCWKCGGSGLDFEGLGDCEYCDGYGYKWWL